MTESYLLAFLYYQCKVSRAVVEVESVGLVNVFVPKKSLKRVKELAYYRLPVFISCNIMPLARSMKKHRFEIIRKISVPVKSIEFTIKIDKEHLCN